MTNRSPGTLFNLYQAKTALSKLVDRAAAGEEIIIAKSGKPLARLVAFEAPSLPRRPGGWEGRAVIGDDFDAPLPEALLTAFESGDGGDAEP